MRLRKSDAGVFISSRHLLYSIAIGLLIGLCARPNFPAAEPKSQKDKPLAPLPREVPAPKDNPTTPEKVALGKQLFFDPRLSGDNTTSCASCHDPKKTFGDGLARAKGRNGKTLGRNAPSLLNVGFYSSYLWDGRTSTLEEQALAPIQSPDEMNQDLDELEKELNAVPGYVAQFQVVFGEKVTRQGIAKALAAFQRTLVAKPSPFDRYLAGEKDAISDTAKEGMRLFMGEAGCVQCHRGPLLSDGKFYRLGVAQRDKGRGAFTGKREDDEKFRTPSLRNVAQTGPYMHDGSQETLYDVVAYYYRNMPSGLDVEPLLGQSFSEVSLLVDFLQSLTGETPDVSPPELP
jgi:cytochrome c peroxidase